jgi:hypothetical protein
MRKKLLLITIILIILLPVSFGEIIVHTSDSQNVQSSSHEFFVNKYYLEQPVYQEKEKYTIFLEPGETEKTIDACQQAVFSFKLINPSSKQHVYRLRIDDFKGIAYITEQIILGAKQESIVSFILEPNCKLEGTVNPKVVVESETGIAKFGLLVHINPSDVIVIKESDCIYHFAQEICDSEDYIRFYQARKYYLDLPFQDPDEDKLKYEAETFNIEVKFKGSQAVLKPRWDWYGSEEIVFTAEDDNGGSAVSKTYYVHVLPSHRHWLVNIIGANIGYVIGLMIIIILVLLFLILLFWPNRHEDYDEEHEDY